jgi:hypothetical protein
MLKFFSRLLSARVISSIAEYICPYQIGFLPNRFIADNGMAFQLAIEDSRHYSSTMEPWRDDIGILLDQEKAYDRVHPTYIKEVIERKGCLVKDMVKVV